jgi:hypothetical protein
MLPHGNILRLRLIAMHLDLVNQVEGLPVSLQHSFLPYALISLPLVLVTLLGFIWVAPVIAAFTIWVLFSFSEKKDSFLFEVKQPQSHFHYVMPLCAFVSLWGCFLFMRKNLNMLPLMSLYSLLLIFVCAPLLRFRTNKKTRWIPLKSVFWFFGILTVIIPVTGLFS